MNVCMIYLNSTIFKEVTHNAKAIVLTANPEILPVHRIPYRGSITKTDLLLVDVWNSIPMSPMAYSVFLFETYMSQKYDNSSSKKKYEMTV